VLVPLLCFLGLRQFWVERSSGFDQKGTSARRCASRESLRVRSFTAPINGQVRGVATSESPTTPQNMPERTTSDGLSPPFMGCLLWLSAANVRLPFLS